ncbi:MAG: hypothetical protein J6C19_13550 [Lachnospiraceae bacterium]|nr:hypothetical protein [Lachnospiraceae bacterium]MBO5146535.1 hypothetical protein [Lachnospiraceae bacterium]
MAGILYDARRIKAYEGLLALGELAGESNQWCDLLWEELVFDQELFEELVFYLEHHYLKDAVHCEGYGLTDLYIWQMNQYNIIGDSGKNTDACNKDRMVLKAFKDMIEMKKEPAPYIRKMTMGRGMDRA